MSAAHKSLVPPTAPQAPLAPDAPQSAGNENIRSLPKLRASDSFLLQSSGSLAMPVATFVPPMLKTECAGSAPASLAETTPKPAQEAAVDQTDAKWRHSASIERVNEPLANLEENSGATLSEPQKNSSKRALATPDAVNVAKKRKGHPTLDKTQLDQLMRSLYPVRKHLGTIVYNPTTIWQTLQFEQLHGIPEHDKNRLRSIRDSYIARRAELFSAEEQKYIPVIPPLTEACINSYLEKKIPYRFIKAFIEEFTVGAVSKKRRLWGGAGGLYTDDSDILYVLCHLGLFDDTLDLTDCNPDWTPHDVIKPLRILKDSDDVDLLDLSVTLLMYPALTAYHGFCKNGIKSRSWTRGLRHDGLSYGVYQVKWESCALSMHERSIFKSAAQELEQDRLYHAQIRATKGGWVFDQKFIQKNKKAAAKGKMK